MRDKSRTLTVVNTTRKTEKAESANNNPNQQVGTSPSTGNPTAIKADLLKIIAENYADTITQLLSASYLHNPSFANDAEGWTISDDDSIENKVRVVISDNKNRLRISGDGSILQKNELVRKPGKHKEYTHTKKEEDTEGGEVTPPDSETEEDIFEPSEELVTDSVEWGGIEEPEKVEGEEEKDNILYLTFNYICKKNGTINIGFVDSDESSEEALKLQSVQMEESEEVQTITSEGTWDGKGDFSISLTEGEVEIVSLYLLDKPLDEYRKQTDSYIKQTIENIGKAFEFIQEVIKRIRLIQNHINQLYSNDSIFKGITDEYDAAIKDLLNTDLFLYEQIESVQDMLALHDERITLAANTATSAYNTASDAYYQALINSLEISTINSTLSTIQELASSAKSRADEAYSLAYGCLRDIVSLESRVESLEKASPT